MRNHKKTFMFGILFLAGSGVWMGKIIQSNTIETRYIVEAVEKGTLVTSVTGTGQIQGESEISVVPETSGKVIQVAVQNGQYVQEGEVLAVLDSTDATKSVRDARLSLASAKLSLQKLFASTDTLSLLQAENALAQAKRTLTDLQNGSDTQDIENAKDAVARAEHDLDQAKRNLDEVQTTSAQELISASEEGYNTVAESFTALSDVMNDLADVMGTTTDEYEYIGYYNLLAGSSYTEKMVTDYKIAQNTYNTAWNAYRISDQNSDTETKEYLIDATLTACKNISNTLNDIQTLLNTIQEQGYETSAIAGHIDDVIAVIPGDIVTVNGHISSLQSASDTIERTNLNAPYNIADAEDVVTEAEATLISAQSTLADLEDGADPDEVIAAQEDVTEKEQQLIDIQAGTSILDVQSQQLIVQERQNTLNDALEAYEKNTVRAPISGTIANWTIYQGQIASSGTSFATIVADNFMASISLNEVDIARVQKENRVNLTFDAIDDLVVTGRIKEIDAIGIVSSNVVSYGVLIGLDTQDERVRSGMTVSTTITTNVKQDVLVVPSTAIKTQGSVLFVEVLDGASEIRSSQGIVSQTSPREVVVEVGLSNDTNSEIVSGLKEGDLIVTRTITQTNASESTTSSSSSLFGGTRTGGGFPGDIPR